MDRRSLSRELVRARREELTYTRRKLEEIGEILEQILRVQMELMARVEENEECLYAMDSDLGSGGVVQDGMMPFGVLLEMAVNRLRN
ncbi:hypothetical protein P3T76_000270 [Phytophthora citrophthora]|uniref:Uncharacterized protein n=1 Tax=Phytophthora citrophthora TaxID=4793 RepID=A0AAD9GZM5_9STRA|nr:hypothetical protein P3T76_000270 [Phytophthora citrophthora]